MIDAKFPHLSRPDRWEWASSTMQFSTDLPPDELVASTHVIAFVGDRVVLCRAEDDHVWFLPGGTREPAESVLESLDRELLEEAGARLLGAFHPIGAHVGRSEAPQPYRPHLPHPDHAWLWGWADAEIVGPPGNPGDGEAVAEVRTFPVRKAMQRLSGITPWGGELILLAAERRAG